MASNKITAEARNERYMTFKSKLRCALAIFESGNAKSNAYQPLLYRLIWTIGVEKIPPHFSSFSENWVFFGFVVCFLWSNFMLVVCRLLGASWSNSLVLVIPVGIAVGVAAGYKMAQHFQNEAEQYKIPLWKDFHPVD
jgi:hypothetical protein